MKSFNVRENITAELKRPSKDSALYTGSILEEDDDDDDHFQPDIDSIIIIFIIWNLCVVEKKESFERRSKSNIQGYIIV
jgi:hypothetical protein